MSLSWVLTYGLLALILILVYFTYFNIYNYAMLKNNTKLHFKMLKSVLRAPLSFFHVNPSGRILNRFSKDQGVMDFSLRFNLVVFLETTAMCMGILVIICLAFPYLVIAMIFIFMILNKIKNTYMISSREIKRYDGITKSPINEQLTANIRVYKIKALCLYLLTYL